MISYCGKLKRSHRGSSSSTRVRRIGSLRDFALFASFADLDPNLNDMEMSCFSVLAEWPPWAAFVKARRSSALVAIFILESCKRYLLDYDDANETNVKL